MAGAKRSTSEGQCSKWSHTFDCGLCPKCGAESPEETRSRVWTARLRAIAAQHGRFPVPPPPDYSTPAAVTERILEACNPWTRELLDIARQEGRIYRAFRRALDRATIPMFADVETPARTTRRVRATVAA